MVSSVKRQGIGLISNFLVPIQSSLVSGRLSSSFERPKYAFTFFDFFRIIL